MATSARLDREALQRILDRQLDLITWKQTLAVGLTDNGLRHRLRPEGPWRSVLPGVYVARTGTPTVAQQEMAALLYGGRGSAITGPAALRAHHIRGPEADAIDVLIPASRRRRDAAFVRLHRTTRPPERIWRFGPLRYALPARAVADAARGLTSLRDTRALVADAIQRSKCEIKDLVTELADGPANGSALLREALSDVAGGIASAPEGDLKDLLAGSGLPMPLFNASLYDNDGTFVARPDAWWPEYGVAVEVDSREWHTSPEDHASTLTRGRRMSAYQIIVLRFTPRQVRTEPAKVLAEIRRTLEGARGRPPLARLAAAVTAPGPGSRR